MPTWKTVPATLAISALIAGVAIAGAIYTGAYNVAASDKHWPVTYWVLKKTVQNSVASHAAHLHTPNLAVKKQLVAGAGHFNENCSGCHAPPGGQTPETAKGMYPAPPAATPAAPPS